MLNDLLATPSEKLEAVYCEAKKSDCLDEVRAQFAKEYLEAVLKSHVESTPCQILQILKTSIRAHSLLHDHERKMSSRTFEQHVTAGFWHVRGKDKSGRPMLWIRMGLQEAAFGSKRSLRRGSQEWYSALRAELYMWQVVTRKAIMEGSFVGVAGCFDMRGLGWLDWSPKYASEMCKVMFDLFPECDEKIYFVGARGSEASMFKIVFGAICRNSNRSQRMVFLSSLEEIYDVIEDASDVPDWYINYSGVVRPHLDKKSLWQYKRCMDGGRLKIGHAEIFNPLSPDGGGLRVHMQQSEVSTVDGDEVSDIQLTSNEVSPRAHSKNSNGFSILQAFAESDTEEAEK